MEGVKDGGADRRARGLANVSDKQVVALIAIEAFGQLLQKGSGHGAGRRSLQEGYQRGTAGV